MARAALSRSRGRHSATCLPDARRAGGGATQRRGARDSEEDRVARLVEPGTRDATCRAGAADRWLSASLSLRAIYSFAPSFRSWCAPAVQRARVKSPTMWRWWSWESPVLQIKSAISWHAVLPFSRSARTWMPASCALHERSARAQCRIQKSNRRCARYSKPRSGSGCASPLPSWRNATVRRETAGALLNAPGVTALATRRLSDPHASTRYGSLAPACVRDAHHSLRVPHHAPPSRVFPVTTRSTAAGRRRRGGLSRGRWQWPASLNARRVSLLVRDAFPHGQTRPPVCSPTSLRAYPARRARVSLSPACYFTSNSFVPALAPLSVTSSR